jgi:hypothetical protein
LRGFGLVLALALGGCQKRSDAVVPIDLVLNLHEQQWGNRGKLGFDRVAIPLYQAHALQPKSPEVLWRLVRLHVHRGLSAETPREAVTEFAAARAFGFECLDGSLPFRQRRIEVGFTEAVELLPSNRMGCAAWTSLAWAQWLVAADGTAAALDLDSAALLAESAANANRPAFGSVAIWAGGLVAAVRPSWAGQDFDRADKLLGKAMGARPADPWIEADRLFLVALPQGDQPLIDQLSGRLLLLDQELPEASRARARVATWAGEETADPSEPASDEG